jgi:hypothetical protein
MLGILKKILMLGFIFIDFFIFIALLTLVGFIETSHFILWYLGATIIISILFGLIGYLDQDKWKIIYYKHKKVRKLRLIVIPFIFVLCLTATYVIPPIITGITAGIIITSYMILQCQDFLYKITQINEMLQLFLKTKYPKVFK